MWRNTLERHMLRLRSPAKTTGLQLKVMDFGIGFDPESDAVSSGLGIVSMYERARLAGGTLTVTSKRGEGTTISADLPVQDHA